MNPGRCAKSKVRWKWKNMTKNLTLLNSRLRKLDLQVHFHECSPLSNGRVCKYRFFDFSHAIQIISTPNSLIFWKFLRHPNYPQTPQINSKRVTEKWHCAIRRFQIFCFEKAGFRLIYPKRKEFAVLLNLTPFKLVKVVKIPLTYA